MVSYAAIILFVACLSLVWLWQHPSFPRLTLHYLSWAPFLPLVALIDHNLYNDVMSPQMRMIPSYVLLGFLLVTWLMHMERGQKIRIGIGELFLIGYSAITLVSVPFSSDPYWSLFTWSWNVPGYLIYYSAGRLITDLDLSKNRSIVYAFWAFIAINLGLIVVAFIIGRVTSIFSIRNLGSIYASNAFLTFVMLYGGISWFQVQNWPSPWRLALVVPTIIAILMTQSRTAVLILLSYLPLLLLLSGGVRRMARRFVFACLIVAIVWIIGAYAADLSSQLWENWYGRFWGWGSIQATLPYVILGRSEVIKDALEHLQGSYTAGLGYGTFYANTSLGYTDAHNLFVTQLFENGIVATFFLYIFFLWASIYVIKSLVKRERMFLAVPIIGFLLVAHTVGAVLAEIGPKSYMTPFYGWMLFFLIGRLVSGNSGMACHRSALQTAKRSYLSNVS